MDVKAFLNQFNKIGIKILNTSIKDNVTTTKIELSLEDDNKNYCIEGYGIAQGNTIDTAEASVENAIQRIANRYISTEKQSSNVIPFSAAQEQNNQIPVSDNQQNNQLVYPENGCIHCGFVPSEDCQDYTRRNMGHVVCRDCQRIIKNGGTPPHLHYTLQPERMKKLKKQTS